MKAVFINILLLLACDGFAQVPGYLGKRFSIGYDLGLSPAYPSGLNRLLAYQDPAQNLSASGKKLGFLSVELKHGVLAEYVVGRTAAVHAGVQYFSFGFSIPATTIGKTNDSFYRSTSRAIKFGFSFSRGNYLMPQGKYFSFEFQHISTINTYVSNQPEILLSNDVCLGLNIDLGQRRLFFDRFLLDMGFGVGLSLDLNTEIDPATPFMMHNYSSFKMQKTFNLFHFKGGLRYLLF